MSQIWVGWNLSFDKTLESEENQPFEGQILGRSKVGIPPVLTVDSHALCSLYRSEREEVIHYTDNIHILFTRSIIL